MKKFLLFIICFAGILLSHAATFTVTNTNTSGAGSLPQAFIDSEANGSADDIVFNLAGAGPFIFRIDQMTFPASILASVQLLTINPDKKTTIIFDAAGDKNSVPRSVPASTSFTIYNIIFRNGAALYGKSLLIDGCTFTNVSEPLFNEDFNYIGVYNTTIRNSTFTNTKSGVKAWVTSSLLTIQNCTFTNIDNAILVICGVDLSTVNISNCQIENCINGITIGGGNTTISNNLINTITNSAINLTNEFSGNYKIKGNIIGSDASLTLKKSVNTGILINTKDSKISIDSNIIASCSTGINFDNEYSNSVTRITRNYIGTNSNGLDLGNKGLGIDINYNVYGSIYIGGKTMDSANVIGYNTSGIYCENDGLGNVIQNNYIGIDKNGKNISNSGYGINIYGGGLIQGNMIANSYKSGIIISSNYEQAIIDNNTIILSGNYGIELQNSGSYLVRITRNYIGTNAAGLNLGNKQSGIYASGLSQDIFIGGLSQDSANVIGFNFSGIYIENAGNYSSTIQNNYIGIDKNGKNIPNTGYGIYLYGSGSIKNNAISNSGNSGIMISEANENLVIENNSITLSQGNGLEIFSSNSPSIYIIKNYIIGNSLPGRVGIQLESNSSKVYIGGKTIDSANVIGFNYIGISAETNSDANSKIFIQNNYIGIDTAGKNIGNSYIGIYTRFCEFLSIKDNKIANSSSKGISLQAKKTIVDNNIVTLCGDGIEIDFIEDGTAIITRNYIGTNSVGQNLGNKRSGIIINNSSNALPIIIGGITMDSANIIGFNNIGIQNASGDSNIIVMQNNYIGIDKNGRNISNESGITTDGGALIRDNIISNSASEGIGITSSGGKSVVTIDNNSITFSGLHAVAVQSSGEQYKITVTRNYIGTNILGQNLGNKGAGIYMDGSSSNMFLGGKNLDSANIIGFNKSGIYIDYNSTNILSYGGIIQNNYIGIDKNGKNIPNSDYGIFLVGTAFIRNNTIANSGKTGIDVTYVEGKTILDNNSITLSGNHGINISSWGSITDNNVILTRNYIGTNVAGLNLGNKGSGINLSNQQLLNVFIGGKTLDSANIIGFNKSGISDSAGAYIQNNYIGIDKSAKNIANTEYGIITFASSSIKGNVIGNAKLDAVFVNQAANNTSVLIDSNQIFSSLQNGINLANNGFAATVRISRNYIGTNAAGANLGNTLSGILTGNTSYSNLDVTIGGKTIDSANIIGFNKTGISDYSGASTLNNYIGMDKNAKNIPNSAEGIKINGNGITNNKGSLVKGNKIANSGTIGINATAVSGGVIVIDSNTIIASGTNGIYGFKGSGSLTITRNYIGTNETGADKGNKSYGIYASGIYSASSSSMISSNTIGFNTLGGVYDEVGSLIKDNYIGVDKSYRNVSNHGNGITLVYIPFSTTGASVQNNSIGFNDGMGILAGSSSNASIQKNHIGGDSTNAYKNKKFGIRVLGNSTITSNMIINNDSGAVDVKGYSNVLSKNIFYGSAKAIYFSTANSNLSQAAGLMTGNTPTASNVVLSGTSTGSSVELFTASSTPETALYYIGTAPVNGSGQWTYTVPKGTGYDPSKDNYYVNTATEGTAGTSMLSQPYKVVVPKATNLNVLPSKAGICFGDSVQVDAVVDNVTYKWIKDGATISTSKKPYIKTSGRYILQVEDTFGNIAKDTIAVTVGSLPLSADFLMASEAGVDDKIVAVDISFTKPDSVLWNWGGATAVWDQNKYLLTFPAVGSYKIKVTSYLGACTKSTEHTITVKPGSMGSPDGIVYPYTIKNVTGAPNPVAEVLTIKADLANEDALILYLYSTQGTLIFTYTTPAKKYAHSYELDMTGYGSGEYLIRVTSGQDERLLRIIKL